MWGFENKGLSEYVRLNRAMQAEMQRLDTAVVPFFRDPHIVDVTADYAKTYKKKLEIPASMLYSGNPFAYSLSLWQ